ncbi:ATP-binding protein [Streptomyces sclerotialus]|uniref:ATP-binding protein n=1 Tax=Streptomyces sclerotialus TaxID=1957 RepID=UPI00055D35F8
MTGDQRRTGNVPAARTRLVDRRAELAEIQRLLSSGARLVTLTGAGGIGKTRLALETAAALRPRFQDGAWLVELSPLSKGTLLPLTIAEALPLADLTTRPAIDVLAEYLADRELLLVLDTCEHLTDACAMAVQVLVRAAPGLRVLATSRRTLDVPGEEVFTVEPLSVPDLADDARTHEAAAMVLLAERAAAVVPGFALTDVNRTEVAWLCRRLEGLPLALELAAARLRDHSVTELTARLTDRYAVLDGTDDELTHAGPPWHRALRTAIGWSHQLCTPPERLLWARLSVFAGTFDAEAVRQVCADAHLPGRKVPALLGALVDNSVLTWVPTGAGERYRMLDTLREFGEGWLRRLGEEDALRRRHRDHYLALARRGDAAWLGADQFAWYDRTTAEHDNLRAALEFCLAHPEDHTALELAGALWFFWNGCGMQKEGQHFMERALALDPAPVPARGKVLWACGLALLTLGDADGGAAYAAECTAAAERSGDADTAAAAAAITMGTAMLRGDVERMTSLARRLLATERPGSALTLPQHLARLVSGHAHIITGRFEEAIAVLEQWRVACDRHGERWMRTFSDSYRAQAELALGRPAAAQSYAQAALEGKHRMHDSLGVAMALDVLAQAASATGQDERAARLLGLARQVWEALGGRPQAGIAAWIAARRSCEERCRDALGDHAYETAYRIGRETGLDTGIAYALTP